jgi:hypothetical protein
MPSDSGSDSGQDTPRRERLTPQEFIQKFSTNFEEVAVCYNDKGFLEYSFLTFAVSKDTADYSRHLDLFLLNDTNEKIKQRLKDEAFFTKATETALENNNFELIEKIIPLIEDRNNIEKLNQLLSDHTTSSRVPNVNIDRVKSAVAVKKRELSCNIS